MFVTTGPTERSKLNTSPREVVNKLIDLLNHRSDFLPINHDTAIFGFRTELPVPMLSRSEFSVWSILKQCIGKVGSQFFRLSQIPDYCHKYQTCSVTAVYLNVGHSTGIVEDNDASSFQRANQLPSKIVRIHGILASIGASTCLRHC